MAVPGFFGFLSALFSSKRFSIDLNGFYNNQRDEYPSHNKIGWCIVHTWGFVDFSGSFNTSFCLHPRSGNHGHLGPVQRVDSSVDCCISRLHQGGNQEGWNLCCLSLTTLAVAQSPHRFYFYLGVRCLQTKRLCCNELHPCSAAPLERVLNCKRLQVRTECLVSYHCEFTCYPTIVSKRAYIQIWGEISSHNNRLTHVKGHRRNGEEFDQLHTYGREGHEKPSYGGTEQQ